MRCFLARRPLTLTFAVLIAVCGFTAGALAQSSDQNPDQIPGQMPPEPPMSPELPLPPEPPQEPVEPPPAVPQQEPESPPVGEPEPPNNDRTVRAPDLPDVGYRSSGRNRADYMPYITLDGLLAALKDGESLIISRHQNRIVIRKGGNVISPYPDISDTIRR